MDADQTFGPQDDLLLEIDPNARHRHWLIRQSICLWTACLKWSSPHREPYLGFYVPLSNAARSQCASVAPASYVLCRNSSNTSSGVSACRTSSYSKMCCDSSGLQKALLGRMGARSNPAGVGSV